ncbi:MAG: tetratricopeptide repeat protein [Burkholderiaceae bacterium]
MNCAVFLKRCRPLTLAVVLLASGCSVLDLTGGSASPSQMQSAADDPGRRLAKAVPAAEATDGSADPATPLPDVDLTPQLLFQILASEIAAQRGQVGSASATYRSMARETRDPRLARRATELALSQRAIDSALPAAELWLELEPGSRIAEQTVETLRLSTGRLKEAEPQVMHRRELAKSENELEAFYAGLERTLGRVTDKNAAYQLLSRVAAKDAGLSSARLALAAAAARAGLRTEAVENAQSAVKLDPNDEETAVTAARALATVEGGKQAAIELLAGFLTRRPEAIEARFAYARLLADAGDKTEASKQFEAALEREPDSPAILYSLAQLAYQTQQKKLARGYLERYVALPGSVQRDNDPAYLFLGQLAEEAGQLKEAVTYFGEVGPGRNYLDARIRQAVLTARLGDVEAGRQMLRQTNARSARERGRLTSAEAEILREDGRLKEAFDLLDDAVKRSPDNTDLLYDHAMAAERLDRMPVVESSLRKVIELQPDSAHAYNALGYTLADRNLRLPEARKLIEKALQLSPDDAHIVDSLGWVLFRQGDLQGAERELRRAYAAAPEAEIATHLGEVLWRMGKKAEARAFWAKAQTEDPDNETLRETLARLNVEL